VIPGITSAVAAASAAGIPVTHRGVARSFAVVTASTAGTAHEPDATDLTRIATAVDTLVLLMAAGRLADTCRSLIEAGRDADEPAALVMWATTPDERTVIGTLSDLPALAAAASLGPPATLIVGEVALIPQQIAAISAGLQRTPGRERFGSRQTGSADAEGVERSRHPMSTVDVPTSSAG
jgi:siroheme synthase